MRPVLACFLAAAALAAQTDPLQPAALEAFLDGVMEAQLKAHHVAGAVVTVVRRDSVLANKGYGYSDVAARKPVDPARTLFRVASNSKMFVWTAVMQLVEQGKLDLNTDVNRYLRGVRIPDAFGAPVTLGHLMTHTAGFEDKVAGLFSHDAGSILPLEELMRRDMPARVFPPGKVTAYSNYGTALAGLIVEQTAGIPYEKYLRERILEPLGMPHATLAQPLPPDAAQWLSKGYRRSRGRWQEQPFEFVPWAPCGGMSMTGADMARFMMSQLAGGEKVLQPATAERMRQVLHGYSPDLAGVLHGFLALDWNGESIYGHGGDTVWFHSLTAVLPAHDLGVFVAYNTDTGAEARTQFEQVFVEHLFPKPLAPEPAPPAQDLARFGGVYAPARVSESDFTSFSKLLDAVRVGAEGGHLVTRSANGTAHWRPAGPLVFEEVDGRRRLVFRQDASGAIADMCASPVCVSVLLRQPWLQTPRVQFAMLGLAMVVLLAALIGYPLAAALTRRIPGLARILAWATAGLLLAGAVLAGFGMDDPVEIVFGMPRVLRAALRIWVLASIPAGLLVVLTAVEWRRGVQGLAARVCLTAVALASIGALLWLRSWHMLGWA